MSTYLVALAVGDFECNEGRGRQHSDSHLRDAGQEGADRLRARVHADRSSSTTTATTPIKYPFKKLDIVAVPDFAAGAMENTAAIFYRETLLLADAKASVATRNDVAEVLAHEIAHQWFGDLVTMQWWDDIWLNEGFATWMETKPIKAWKPEWHVELKEIGGQSDGDESRRLARHAAIRSKAETPAEINELFDPIAYEKGAAVLRMIEAWVGEAASRRASTRTSRNTSTATRGRRISGRRSPPAPASRSTR